MTDQKEKVSGVITYHEFSRTGRTTILRLNSKRWIKYLGALSSDILGMPATFKGITKKDIFYAKHIDVHQVNPYKDFEHITKLAEKNGLRVPYLLTQGIGFKLITKLYQVGKKALIIKLLKTKPTKLTKLIRNPFELYANKYVDFYIASLLAKYNPLLTPAELIYPCALFILDREFKNKQECLPLDVLTQFIETQIAQLGYPQKLSVQLVKEALISRKSSKITIENNLVYLSWLYFCKKRTLAILEKNKAALPPNTDNVTLQQLLGYQWVVLTGQAGTGKTTLIKELAKIYPNTIVAATTGKAAKNISETTPTVHHLFGFSPDGFRVKKLNCSLLVVDEASMLDWYTLYHIVNAVPRAIFVGDPNQLPPVHGDAAFKKLLDYVPTIALTKVFRFKNAMQVEVIKRRTYEDLVRLVRIMASRFLRERKNFQVITPLVQTAQHLNREIKLSVNPAKDYEFRKGDKIIVTENVYQNGQRIAANGEIGFFLNFNENGCTVLLGNRKVTLPLQTIQLAYALTVHKCQGSEYDYVIFAIPPGIRQDFLSEELKYVGQSRARIKTYLIECQ